MKAEKVYKPRQVRTISISRKPHSNFREKLEEARTNRDVQAKINIYNSLIEEGVICNDKKKVDFFREITNFPRNSDSYGFEDESYWVCWPANCTGDLPSMTVAMLSGFLCGINICNAQGVSAESKISEVCSYLGAQVVPDDNRFIINSNGWVATCNARAYNKKIKFSKFTRVLATGEYFDNRQPEIRLEGRKYDDGVKNSIRNVWLGNINYDVAIQTWLDRRGIKLNAINQKDIIVLWIRKSGERGGAHPENDTSFKALRNYINTNPNFVYILAGDKKEDKTSLLAQMNNVYDLTEFWKGDSTIKTWGGNTRTGQLRIFDYLQKKSKSLKHVGSMSGGLEALALIGHDVEFKAKSGEVGVSRMEQYEQNDDIHYKRIDFSGNHRYYDYKGFEKSFAKYYVFFSSGIIQGNINEAKAQDLYRDFYNPQKDYKIYGSGLSGKNAETAIGVSKKLAKEEKEKYKNSKKRKK